MRVFDVEHWLKEKREYWEGESRGPSEGGEEQGVWDGPHSSRARSIDLDISGYWSPVHHLCLHLYARHTTEPNMKSRGNTYTKAKDMNTSLFHFFTLLPTPGVLFPSDTQLSSLLSPTLRLLDSNSLSFRRPLHLPSLARYAFLTLTPSSCTTPITNNPSSPFVYIMFSTWLQCLMLVVLALVPSLQLTDAHMAMLFPPPRGGWGTSQFDWKIHTFIGYQGLKFPCGGYKKGIVTRNSRPVSSRRGWCCWGFMYQGLFTKPAPTPLCCSKYISLYSDEGRRDHPGSLLDL